jgi:tRNA (guanine37-N1)-methyltransferase
MKIDIISLFPDIFNALNSGVCSRALTQGEIVIKQWNPRDYTNNKHKTVDDRPYGGGPGMVMSYEPLANTLNQINSESKNTHTIYLTPQGKPLTQKVIHTLSQKNQLTLIAGRYAGIDQRVIDNFVDEEYSVGDYILSGGEIPALIVIDAIARLLPGTLGNSESPEQDSFSNGLLAGPYYTRPETINQKTTPKVLISGNHKEINEWRQKESLRKTWQNRPDLLKRLVLDTKSRMQLNDIINEGNSSKEDTKE